MYPPFGADDQFINAAHGTRNVPALAVEHASVCIFKLYKMMVKYFSMILAFTNLAATHSLGFYRVRFFEPVYDIKIVNVLFCNVITAEPVEIIPVPHLIFHFCLFWFPW